MSEHHHTSAATTGPLLPCPFCGSKPVRFWTSDYQQLAQVRCENDDCFGPSTPVASARDADRMWNRRISVPAQQPIDPDLVQRCKELLGWSKTGLLNGGSGGAVRALADRLRPKIGDHYALNVAENQTKDDAMREIVRLAAHPPAAPVEKEPAAIWADLYKLMCGFPTVQIGLSSMLPADKPKLDDQAEAIIGAALPRISAGTDAPYYHAWLEMVEHCNKLKEENYHLRNAQPQTAPSREDIARVIGGDIFHGSDDGVGPATRHARVEALKKADAILALSRPHQRGGE
jgi:hypothetical protein